MKDIPEHFDKYNAKIKRVYAACYALYVQLNVHCQSYNEDIKDNQLLKYFSQDCFLENIFEKKINAKYFNDLKENEYFEMDGRFKWNPIYKAYIFEYISADGDEEFPYYTSEIKIANESTCCALLNSKEHNERKNNAIKER